ncbi:hypothetical protein BKA82DRAFT_26106 [Pisolithus tinctorius]|uniref:Uncharacterized protein n=1 Tax=Pisolithus tinctorius Marx 270 TaxID=870435 RepID=A0A0C3J6I0_PISTI|nr:hypothetical protein BKA82DRAFT_26106 [Pisolithus tinctorius]KIO04653.1 hypothetical protein M404DRAFT_26106 [Pisolithus tinctorius Marx 270]
MSKDFTLDIDAVGHDSLDENTDTDEDVPHAANHGAARGAGTSLDRELDEVRRVMAAPVLDASPAELHQDFEFYIELLRKQENKKWALGIFEHFDNAVFGANRHDGSQQPPPEAEDSVEVPRSWEDDILAQLGGVGGTAEVNSNPPTVPITSQSATHPSILTGTIQAEDFPPPQIRMNLLGAASTAWGNGTSISGAIQPNTNLSISVLEAGTISPSQSVIVSATSSELSLPLSTLSLGSSQPSVSTPLNPPDPLVVMPALVSGRSSKATKKGKKATQGQAKATEEGIGAVPARVTRVTRQKK